MNQLTQSPTRGTRAILAISLAALLTPTLAFAQAKPKPVGASTSTDSPYRYAGRLLFSADGTRYIGSATVVKARGVLTAGHNLYDPFDGFSNNIKFERGRYDSRVLKSAFPTRSIILSGYVANADDFGPDSSRAFQRDLAVLRFNTTLAGGNHATVRSGESLLKESGRYKESLGYGADNYNGQKLLFVGTTRACTVIRKGYYDNNGFTIEGGMSGGATFAQTGLGARLVAILVSGSRVDTGLRAIDDEGLNFINNNL